MSIFSAFAAFLWVRYSTDQYFNHRILKFYPSMSCEGKFFGRSYVLWKTAYVYVRQNFFAVFLVRINKSFQHELDC